ncbi:MAG: BatD family protein [Gammaproteobacteria bacterium]|nr:BatD family protein [Gammaproteobacteria bacterium]
MVKKFLFLSVFTILSLFVSHASAADIRVFVDRQNITTNESFNLVFEADGTVDAEPDFSPLSVYFDILNKSQSSNMTIINGNFNRKTVWTLVLLAKQAGNYSLPSIDFGNDKSPGLNIKIQKSSASPSAADKNLFLEAEIDQPSVYVQAQLIYTVKLFRSVDIQNASLTEPELSHADAIVEKLGEDKRYQTTRDGVRFVVIERRYAIFPQQSGSLSIKPLEFNGQIVAQRRSFFDSIPFSNSTKRVYSKQIDIEVKPVPALFKNKNWLPSSQIKLVDEWPDNTEFKVGEPVTRTITLMANGLTAAQLPVMAIKDIEGVKQYPDQPSLNDTKDDLGITGIRQEKIAFIPTRSGSVTLPELSIAWWNTLTEKVEYARIAAKQITIKAGATVSSTAQAPALAASKTPASTSSTAIPQQTTNFWFYSSLVLLIVWLTTLYFLLTLKRHTSVVTNSPSTTKPVTKNISKKIISACHVNNTELCKSLLIEWASQTWPGESFSSLSDVALKLDTDFAEQVRQLNRSLYSDHTNDWQAKELLSCFEKFKGKPLASVDSATQTLKPLHKLA